MVKMGGWYEPRVSDCDDDFDRLLKRHRAERRKLQNAKDKAVYRGDNAVIEHCKLINAKLHYILEIRKKQVEEEAAEAAADAEMLADEDWGIFRGGSSKTFDGVNSRTSRDIVTQ